MVKKLRYVSRRGYFLACRCRVYQPSGYSFTAAAPKGPAFCFLNYFLALCMVVSLQIEHTGRVGAEKAHPFACLFTRRGLAPSRPHQPRPRGARCAALICAPSNAVPPGWPVVPLMCDVHRDEARRLAPLPIANRHIATFLPGSYARNDSDA